MLNIVIPMAGAGSRFAEAGYKDPKPLIPVNNVPMIQLVIDNLTPRIKHRFIFICQRDHVQKYKLQEKFSQWAPGCEVVMIDTLTEGAACTVLLAKELINQNEPLMIANSDQFVDTDINEYLEKQTQSQLDGLIMTMKADDAKWSYVGYADNGQVNRVVEKQVISDDATVGIYNFARGSDFVSGAEEMIERNDRTNNEFYVAPVYNYLINNGASIGSYNIGTTEEGMYGLGTPKDLDYFLSLPLSHKATQGLR